jgi:extracellular elastinolytic metalloproteinase
LPKPDANVLCRGNNVIAVKLDRETGTTIATNESAPGLVFDYPYDPTKPANSTANLDAARTNVFVLLNQVHDIAYRYGFTESAFNFQENNGNKTAGKGGDPVIVSVQDASGFNNANMATPPEYFSPPFHARTLN